MVENKNKSDISEQEKIKAFEAIMANYEGPLLRYVIRMVKDRHIAEDIVQETFIRLFRKQPQPFKISPAISTWLYKVAHRCTIDYLRKIRRQTALLKKMAQFQEEEMYIQNESTDNTEIIMNALDRLSSRQKELIILKVFEEKSYKEISQITGLSISNVGYILHNAMKKLTKILSDYKNINYTDEHENRKTQNRL